MAFCDAKQRTAIVFDTNLATALNVNFLEFPHYFHYNIKNRMQIGKFSWRVWPCRKTNEEWLAAYNLRGLVNVRLISSAPWLTLLIYKLLININASLWWVAKRIFNWFLGWKEKIFGCGEPRVTSEIPSLRLIYRLLWKYGVKNKQDNTNQAVHQ